MLVTAMLWVSRAFFLLTLPVSLPLFWLTCRLGARPCPRCGSKWRTELIGEWDGEDWTCHACGLLWIH